MPRSTLTPTQREPGERSEGPRIENGGVVEDIEVVGDHRSSDTVSPSHGGNRTGNSNAGERTGGSHLTREDVLLKKEGVIRKAEERAARKDIEDERLWEKEREERCSALKRAIADSNVGISLYKDFLAGKIEFSKIFKHAVEIGNAWKGVTAAGKKLPPIIQEVIAELERFNFGEEGAQMLRIAWATIQPGDLPLMRAKASIEIERHTHFNEIARQKMRQNGCQ